MSDNEVAIAIIAVIFGSTVAIVVVSKLIGLAKTWINRNESSYGEEKFDRLAKAFIKYKKDSERRLQNLEAIISNEDSDQSTKSANTLKAPPPHTTLEINTDEAKQENKSGSGKLRNMLGE